MTRLQLTEEQRRAVMTEGNVVVTAGAGTGKTSAMTERIIRVLGSLDDIHQLLVVTFTDEAAGEIRRRVYAALLDRIRESTGEERIRFERLRDHFPQNHISTMHTFFAYLLRRFPDAVEGVDPDFRIVQGAEQEDLLRGAVDSVLDRIATVDDDPLREALRLWLRQRRRAGVRAAIEALIRRRTETLPWIERFATEDVERLYEREASFARGIIDRARDVFFSDPEVEVIRDLLETSLATVDAPTDRLVRTAQDVFDGIENRDVSLLKSALLRKDGTSRTFGNVGRAAVWGREQVAVVRAQLTAFAARFAETPLLHLEWDEAVERAVLRQLRALARLTAACLDAYARRKSRLRVLDFVDLELLAARLLANETILRVLQRQFRAIFIDEFQDTNRFQWRLFRKIACEEGTDRLAGKLFIVGDEKQAIYEFRGGEVEVCRIAKREIDTALEFTANFRSKPNLLLFFNRFFDRLLTGGEPYEAEAQALRHGDTPTPPEESVPDGGTVRHFVILNEDRNDDETMRDVEREAYAVAELLREIVDGEREEDYPGIADRIRRGEPTVGILFRRTTHQRLYEDALRAFGVRFVAARGRGFYDRLEVRDLRNALAVLVDLTADIPLAGLLRSPLIGCSDDSLLLLANARRHPAEPLIDALRRFAPDPVGTTPEDAAALRKAMRLIDRWQRIARSRSIAELLVDILEESGVYGALAVGSDGLQRTLNVEKFVAIARAYESQGVPTLADFVRFLDTQAQGDEEEGDADLPEGGSIQLLTVHRAKGLEWPLVILPDTNGPFRHQIEERRWSAGRSQMSRIAIGLLSRDGDDPTAEVTTIYRDENYEESKPFLWEYLREGRRRRSLAEQRRLLYVAFTRAAEHLVICTRQDPDAENVSLDRAKSWADWIRTILSDEAVTAGIVPFYRRDVLAPAQKPEPKSRITERPPVQFDPTRIWAPPTLQPERYRVTDEPVDERGQIPPLPELADLRKIAAERLVWNRLGNDLLRIAWKTTADGASLHRRAAAHSRFLGAILPEASLLRLAAAVERARNWLRENFSDRTRLLWNRTFEWTEPTGRRLVGQVDLLARTEDGSWTAIDIKYGDRRADLPRDPSETARQIETLCRTVASILGVASVRGIVLAVWPEGIESWEQSTSR